MIEIKLTRVFRQKNAEEANLLNRVRTGTLTRKDFDTINRRVQAPSYDSVVLTPYRRTMYAINRHKNNELPTETYEFHAEKKGKTSNLEDALPDVLRIRRGARVIIKKNIQRVVQNEVQSVVNGDTATFLGLDKFDRAVLLVDRLSDTVVLRREKLQELKPYVEQREDGSSAIRDKELGSLKQYPMDLGFAITVHASQGSTIPKVHLALPMHPVRFTYNLMYVALSRCPSFENLTLNRPITPEDILSTEQAEGTQQYEFA